MAQLKLPADFHTTQSSWRNSSDAPRTFSCGSPIG